MRHDTDVDNLLREKAFVERIADLEAALAPFARAYGELLDNKPSPDVVMNTLDEEGRYGKCLATIQWSDLYRAANLLRETLHA